MKNIYLSRWYAKGEKKKTIYQVEEKGTMIELSMKMTFT